MLLNCNHMVGKGKCLIIKYMIDYTKVCWARHLAGNPCGRSCLDTPPSHMTMMTSFLPGSSKWGQPDILKDHYSEWFLFPKVLFPRVIIPKFLSPPLAWKTVVGYWDCKFISVWVCMCRCMRLVRFFVIRVSFEKLEVRLQPNLGQRCNRGSFMKTASFIDQWQNYLNLSSAKWLF